jgi:hypothetical protein
MSVGFVHSNLRVFFWGGTPFASFFPYKRNFEQVFSANQEKQDIPKS